MSKLVELQENYMVGHRAEKYILFDFLVRGLRAGVEDASGEVVDEANPLGDTDLLLLCQLAGQARLTGGGVVHWRLNTLLYGMWGEGYRVTHDTVIGESLDTPKTTCGSSTISVRFYTIDLMGKWTESIGVGKLNHARIFHMTVIAY